MSIVAKSVASNLTARVALMQKPRIYDLWAGHMMALTS
jgi:hypothetical protein